MRNIVKSPPLFRGNVITPVIRIFIRIFRSLKNIKQNAYKAMRKAISTLVISWLAVELKFVF
jgi:hypothetical protein